MESLIRHGQEAMKSLDVKNTIYMVLLMKPVGLISHESVKCPSDTFVFHS